MELSYTYWEDKDGWLIGYLDAWPDHWTQGKGIEELEEMLRDLYEFYKDEQAKVTAERKHRSLKVAT